MARTLFELIIAREIPSRIEYEDERCIVIHDIAPQAPVHLLVIPKKVVARISAAKDEDEAVLGHLLVVAGQVATRLKLEKGFRIVANTGPDAGETIPHVHLHLLSGRPLAWPPG